MQRLEEHLEKLLPFVTIAELGSLHRAADRLHTSQPALTQMLKSLEGKLGVRLFSRTPRGVVVTDEGERLYEFAKTILKQTASFTFAAEPEGRALRLATYESLADLMAAHVGSLPEADRYEIQCQVSGLKLIDLLAGGDTDYIVLADPPKVRGVSFEKLVDASYGLYGSKAYLERRGRIKADKIGLEPLIYVPGSVSTSAGTIDRFVAAAGLGQGRKLTVNSYVVAKSLTLADQGLGILVDALVAHELSDKRLREVKLDGGLSRPTTSVYLGTREGQEARSQYKAVRDAVVTALRG